jgi:hypothetical protein
MFDEVSGYQIFECGSPSLIDKVRFAVKTRIHGSVHLTHAAGAQR